MAKGASGLDASDLIYLIFPDRFANGDPSNDRLERMQDQSLDRGAMFDRHGGDLQGVMDHLDYLESLGVTALWLNPVWESNQPEESYHGYAPTDLYKIDARLGTNDEYKELVDLCHDRGIKVIKDIVYNHWGDQHWIYKDLPDSSWVNFWPEFTRTTYRAPTLLDPHVAASDRKRMTDGWFDHHMPDLNQRNPHLANYLIQHSVWWVAHFGVDAFRIDTYAYPDQLFMKDLAERMSLEFPGFFCFGETWVHGTPVQAWFTDESGVHRAWESGLQSVTDFQLHYAINKVMDENDGWTEGAARLYYLFAKDVIYKDPNSLVTFLDNHDLSRVRSILKEDERKLQVALGLLYTARGIPQIYYGTEIGLKNYADPDGKVRQDFPGGWSEDSLNYFESENREGLEKRIFDYTAGLGQYRKANPDLFKGDMTQFVPVNGVYFFIREGGGKQLLVVVNPGNVDRNFQFSSAGSEFKGNQIKEILNPKGGSPEKSLSLSPFSIRFFEITQQ